MALEKEMVQVAMNGGGRDRPPPLPSDALARGRRRGCSAAIPLSFTDWMALHAADLRKRQMACILLWMGGGPSQLETFDPKPGTEHGGETKSIATAVPSISIAEGWDQTAKVMKDIALVRSMTNKEGNHQRATYQLHTGYLPSATVKHPHLGCSVVSELGESKFDLPHIVSIGGADHRRGFSRGRHRAVRGPERAAAAREHAAQSRPRALPPPTGIARSHRESRASSTTGGGDRVRDHKALYRQTSRMILSPHMRAFDLAEEPAPLRDAYGRTPFGQGCLLARRLVQAGVTFVEVRSNGWDTHQQSHDRVGKLADQVDPGFATLIADLKQRGMLDQTLVVWMGEFGRTPKINANAGRDHFPKVFNVALAGGGIKGGQVIGTSNADGTEVKDHPVTVPDLLASFCHSLKVDPAKEMMSPIGRPIKIVDGGKARSGLYCFPETVPWCSSSQLVFSGTGRLGRLVRVTASVCLRRTDQAGRTRVARGTVDTVVPPRNRRDL